MAALTYDGIAQQLFEPDTVLAVGAHTFGPFSLDPFSGILLDITRSDDGTNGTCTLALVVNDLSLGALAQLDGAGAAVAINDWGAGENERRILQVHPTAGPIPSSDADGVFTVGTTGVAASYYRQPVLSPFSFVITPATDASTFSGATLYLLR